MARAFTWSDLSRTDRGTGFGTGTGWSIPIEAVIAEGATLERVIARLTTDAQIYGANLPTFPIIVAGRTRLAVTVEAAGSSVAVCDSYSPVIPFALGVQHTNGTVDGQITWSQAYPLEMDQRIRRGGSNDVEVPTRVDVRLEYHPEPINGSGHYPGWNWQLHLLILTSQAA